MKLEILINNIRSLIKNFHDKCKILLPERELYVSIKSKLNAIRHKFSKESLFCF